MYIRNYILYKYKAYINTQARNFAIAMTINTGFNYS